jgi:hypothetical protein
MSENVMDGNEVQSVMLAIRPECFLGTQSEQAGDSDVFSSANFRIPEGIVSKVVVENAVQGGILASEFNSKLFS